MAHSIICGSCKLKIVTCNYCFGAADQESRKLVVCSGYCPRCSKNILERVCTIHGVPETKDPDSD